MDVEGQRDKVSSVPPNVTKMFGKTSLTAYWLEILVFS